MPPGHHWHIALPLLVEVQLANPLQVTPNEVNQTTLVALGMEMLAMINTPEETSQAEVW